MWGRDSKMLNELRAAAWGHENITFVEEHGGHLTHLHPLHDLKVVHVPPRPLCGNTEDACKDTHAHEDVRCSDNSWFLSDFYFIRSHVKHSRPSRWDKMGLVSGSARPRTTASSSEYSELESLSSTCGDKTTGSKPERESAVRLHLERRGSRSKDPITWPHATSRGATISLLIPDYHCIHL